MDDCWQYQSFFALGLGFSVLHHSASESMLTLPNTFDPGHIAADITDSLMPLLGEEMPFDNIKSAVCLNNGNLLLELSSAKAADWMRSAPVREALSKSLGITAVVKEHAYTLVVPFFPTSIEITDPLLLNTIELENDLPANSLQSIHWAKHPERRKPV
ncbi:hypothetical protein EDD15DRAFT_2361701 [Pisolithus albus]|nr:hypothetical protein EDD15DRAFT_2361701 [Pisolithus albus]